MPSIQTPVASAPAGGPRGEVWVWYKEDFIPAFNDWFSEEAMRCANSRNWSLKISKMNPAMLGAAVAANDTADLVMHTLSTAELAARQVLRPVTDIVARIEAEWGSASASMRQDHRIEGAWYAVPYFQRSDGGWFLREPFDEAGIDIHAIRSYEALAEACLGVSEPPDLYGWGMTINRCGDADWFIRRVLHGWGAYLQDEPGDLVTLGSPEMVAAMRWLTDIYLNERWADMLEPNVRGWNDMANNKAFLDGTLAYTQNGGTIYGTAWLSNSPLLDQIGYHVPCGGPAHREFNRLSANTFMLLKAGKNATEAEQTILHFCQNADTIDETFRQAPGFSLPAYTELWDASKSIGNIRVAMEQRPTATDPDAVRPGVWPGPDSAALNELWQRGIISDMVRSILNSVAVEDAVATAHQAAVAIWKMHGMPGE